MRYLHWIHTRYIVICFPRFTCNRRSTRFWIFCSPAVVKSSCNSSGSREEEKEDATACIRLPPAHTEGQTMLDDGAEETHGLALQGNANIRQDLITVLWGIKITVSLVSLEFTFHYQGSKELLGELELQRLDKEKTAGVSDMGIASSNQLREHLLTSRDISISPHPGPRGISEPARAKKGTRPTLLNGGNKIHAVWAGGEWDPLRLS